MSRASFRGLAPRSDVDAWASLAAGKGAAHALNNVNELSAFAIATAGVSKPGMPHKV